MANAYDFSFKKLGTNDDLPLSQFTGRALLVVNVASACGLTPQYRDLETLFESKEKKGLTVLGVPCNDFGGQEAGTEAEIGAFCETRFAVKFPLTGKVDIVSLERRHPFYAWIAQELGDSALPRWNFHKYLIGRDGELLDSRGSKEAPLSIEFLSAVEKALAA